MRFAYADPPYPGKARKYYRGHPDFAGEVDHAELIGGLEERLAAGELDGWALSTSASALPELLPLCPAPVPRGAVGGGVRRQYRLLSWCSNLARYGGDGGPLYGWEPVILRGGRRTTGFPFPRDWLVCSPELYQLRPKPDGHVTGAKPPGFARWLFGCLGALPGDELEDVFPGSGAISDEWDKYTGQLQLGEQVAGLARERGWQAGQSLEID